jgi:hypothetical protein
MTKIIFTALLFPIFLFSASGNLLQPINLWDGVVPSMAPDSYLSEFAPAFCGGSQIRAVPTVIGSISGLNVLKLHKLPQKLERIADMSQVIFFNVS